MEFKSWWDRVLYYRERRSLTYLFLRHWKEQNKTLRTRLHATYKECALVYNKLKEIVEEINQFGEIIKRTYGVSKIVQFYQILYLSFFIGVPIKNYRTYLLFKRDRWKSVKGFTYDNIEPEKEMISMKVRGVDYNFRPNDDFFKDKSEFYDFCIENDIPTPEVLLEVKLSELPNRNLTLPKQDLFIKTIDGARGFGAHKLYYRENRYEDENGKLYDIQKLISFFNQIQYNSKKDRKEFIFQPVIQNHPDWMPFTSGALTTCRILTSKAIESDDIIPIAASLRMPSGNAIADNFSGGGIASPINISNGELGTGLTYKPKGDTFEFDYHPDTKQKLTGTLLPAWDELLEFTIEVHKKVDFIFVSWDISYTTEGFMVIEGNGLWDVDILESSNNCPLSKTRYPEMYDKWMKHLVKLEKSISSYEYSN